MNINDSHDKPVHTYKRSYASARDHLAGFLITLIIHITVIVIVFVTHALRNFIILYIRVTMSYKNKYFSVNESLYFCKLCQ